MIFQVGNKVDLERSRQVATSEGKELARSYDAKFIETSAGLKHNVDELLVGVLKQILLRQESSENPPRVKVDNLIFAVSMEMFKLFLQHSRGQSCSSLATLSLAREILLRMCSDKIGGSKSCENLHVL